MKDSSETLIFIGLMAICGGIVYATWIGLKSHDTQSGLQSPQEVAERQVAIPPTAEPRQQIPATSQPEPQLTRPAAKSNAATAYRWVDQNGTVHFSDRPSGEGAEQIALAEASTMRFPAPQPVTRIAEAPAQTAPAQPARYASMPNGGTVQVNRGVFQSGEGYRITTNAKHFGEELSFEGRVENGPTCRALQLTGLLTDQSGQRVLLKAIAANVGSGSQLFESDKLHINRLKSGWDVVSVQVGCVQR